MKTKETLTKIKGYLRSTFPLYKLAKDCRFMTKNLNLLTNYTCFETPAYFSRNYNLSYRMQAYAENVSYIQNAKSKSILFDFGSKKLIKQDSTAFFKLTQSQNYGKLKKSAFYQIFPSMHRQFITQQVTSSATIAYLNNKNRLIVGAEPWFNSKLKPVIHRKKNYLFPSKLISDELDQLISKFDSQWASILKTKSAAYCLTTPSSYFSFIVDANLNWDSLPYQFFRYYDVLRCKTDFLTKQFNQFWSSLIVSKCTVSLNNFLANTSDLVINQIQYNLTTKLYFNKLLCGVETRSLDRQDLLICSYASTVYANNFFVSLLITMLCKRLPISITWIFNKLSVFYKNTKMVLEPGLNLLAKAKTLVPAKSLTFVETWNQFFFQPAQLSHGTGITLLNDTLKLRKMKNYILNKKPKYNFNLLANVIYKNIFSKLIAFKLFTIGSTLLTKINLNMENLQVYRLTLKNRVLISRGKKLQFLPLRLQLLTLQSKSPSWNCNLQFILARSFFNANEWLVTKFTRASNLILKYCEIYNKVLKAITKKFHSRGINWNWRLTKENVINSAFFFFFTKKKTKETHWKKIKKDYSKELNFIYKNYHLFSWFYWNMSSEEVELRTAWMESYETEAVKAINNLKIFRDHRAGHTARYYSVVKATPPLKTFNPYKVFKMSNFKSLWLPLILKPVFFKYDNFKKALKFHKVSIETIKELKYPKKWQGNKNENISGSKNWLLKNKKIAITNSVDSRIENRSSNPNYKGKNFDPNYHLKKRQQNPVNEHNQLNIISEAVINKSMTSNPNYKGKNFDPNYHLKKRQQNPANEHNQLNIISEAVINKSMTSNPNYKGKNFDPNYHLKKRQQNPANEHNQLNIISEAVINKKNYKPYD